MRKLSFMLTLIAMAASLSLFGTYLAGEHTDENCSVKHCKKWHIVERHADGSIKIKEKLKLNKDLSEKQNCDSPGGSCIYTVTIKEYNSEGTLTTSTVKSRKVASD